MRPCPYPFLHSLLGHATGCFKGLTGVYIKYRYSGKLFNLQCLHAKTNVFRAIMREFLFADDCALAVTYPVLKLASRYATGG